MDDRLKNAASQGDVAFFREAVASKPIEYFKLKYVPRYGSKEIGGNIFHLAAINQRVEFIREALEALPFLVVHFLLDEDFLLQHTELVRLIEDFYERRNPMDSQLKNAAIQGDVKFLKEAFASKKPIEYFKSKHFPCPTLKEKGGNIFHLAAYHGRVEFFKTAMEILPISEVDFLLWQENNVRNGFFGKHVLKIAKEGLSCGEFVELIEEFYGRRNSMDEELKKAAIEGDVEFLRKAVTSTKSIEYFQSLYFVPDPYDDEEQVGNILHLAARNRRAEFLREAFNILPEAGVDVHHLLCKGDHPKYRRNPLHVAAKRGYNKIVKVILDYYENSLLSAPANSSQRSPPLSSSSSAQSTNAMDFRGQKPWLVKDKNGKTPFHYIMEECREECVLRLLSLDKGLFSQMDDCPGDDFESAPLIYALSRGFSKVILKFWDSDPNWHSFDKRVLAYALGYAPNCSDEIFKRVLEQNLQLIKDMNFYCISSPLGEWASIGKLYPFKYVLENEVHAPHLRRYLIDRISKENPLFEVVWNGRDEAKSVEIATIIVNAYKTEREQLNTTEVEPPWAAKNLYGHTPLHDAMLYRREEVALYLLSLDKIELLLERHNFLILAVERKCVKVAEKILELIDQHGLKSLLTLDTGCTVLHDAPKCKGDFVRQVLKRHPQLIEQCDDDGVSVLHSWMEIGEIWPFQCILNKDDFSIDIRKSFVHLLKKETEDTMKNPLHVAAAAGADGVIEDIVQLLFDSSREENIGMFRWDIAYVILGTDSEGNTPVDIALSTGNEKLTLCLLSALEGYYLESKARDILFKAIDKQSHSVVKYLLDQIHEKQWGPGHLRLGWLNALHVASKCTEENAKLIVERWPELIDACDENGKTPLERASEAGANWLIRMILQKERTSILKVPLAWVEPCEKGDLSTILAFAENTYFRYICREHHDTPLHHIKFKDYNKYQDLLKCELIQELKDARDLEGDTPLHKAIKNRNKDLTEILFTKEDVDWTIKNNDGRTAMDLLEEEASNDSEWKKFCDAIGVNPWEKTTYISRKTDLPQMRETISLVAALLATITFTAGFTVPGGFKSDTGEAILTKKPTFVVFLLADTYAMCCSMLILFSIIWSMVCDRNKASFLADRSLELLKHSLYGTLLAFMTGVYTIVHKKSLWTSIVILIMCSTVVILAQRRVLYSMFGLLNLVAKIQSIVKVQLPSCWEKWTSYMKSFFRRRCLDRADAVTAQNQTTEIENNTASSTVV